MADQERKLQNNLILRQHHQYQIDHDFTPYLEMHDWVNKLIERFSHPFDYTPSFYSRIYYSHILTHDWLSRHKPYADTGTNTNNKEYTDTSVQTDNVEPTSQLALATYINIRKCLDELQRQQRLENQYSVGTNTETDIVDIDINSQFDETAWLNPYKTPAWADYETQSEPSLESVELAVLRDLYKSDSASSDTEHVIAAEPTSESPPTHTEINMSPPPRLRKRRYQPDNKETPRWSLRIKTMHQSKKNCSSGSSPIAHKGIQLLKVWHILKIGLAHGGEYLEIANFLYDRNTLTQD